MTDSVKSTHIPEYSGAIVTVPDSGALIVDTELRSLQGFGAVLAQAQVATVAGVSATPIEPSPGGTWKLLLETWEDDNTTAAGVTALVSWTALGK